jgi:hypothetical protein
MTSTAIDGTLRKRYELAWPELERIREDHPRLSWPHLIRIPDGYASSHPRIMIIGRETTDWAPKDRHAPWSVDLARDTYAHFLKHNPSASPFWKAFRALGNTLGGPAAVSSMIWTNLFKFAQQSSTGRWGLSDSAVRDAVSALGLLQAEIEITRPQVIVFFTGPGFDDRLKMLFQGVEFRPVLDNISATKLARLEGSILPSIALRSYHPNYLQLSAGRTAPYSVETLAGWISARMATVERSAL